MEVYLKNCEPSDSCFNGSTIAGSSGNWHLYDSEHQFSRFKANGNKVSWLSKVVAYVASMIFRSGIIVEVKYRAKEGFRSATFWIGNKNDSFGGKSTSSWRPWITKIHTLNRS